MVKAQVTTPEEDFRVTVASPMLVAVTANLESPVSTSESIGATTTEPETEGGVPPGSVMTVTVDPIWRM